MPTGDGLLVRFAPRDRALTPQAARDLAGLAARDGNGRLEITARGHWQVRGLRPDTAARFAADMSEAVEAVDTRIDPGPLAGLDPGEIADARLLSAALAETVGALSLSPKLSIVVDGGGAVSLDDVGADLRLRATAAGLWSLEVAGSVRTTGSADAVLDATRAVLRELAGGDARPLFEDPHGGTAPPRTPPDKREGGQQRGTICNQRGSLYPAASRLSGGVRGGVVRLGSMPFGAIALRDGLIAFGITAAFGAIAAPDLASLATCAEQAGVSSLRLSPGRMLLLVGSMADRGAALRHTLATAGWITEADDPLLKVAACPGTDGCASGLVPARAIARALVPALGATPFLHVSGCPKGCAHPQPAALTLVGRDDGLAIVINGRAGDEPLSLLRRSNIQVGLVA